MAIGPKGPPQKPGLSIRGRVIFDTVRGVPRVRPWPPKKPTKPGSKRNLTAKAFGAANRACKVTASVFYGEHWAATRGTPLLPRDLMIAMMYGRAFALVLEDGRIIRSMASRNDVSTSLDMITQEEGKYLIRGPKYWEAAPPPVTGQWAYLGATIVSAPISAIVLELGLQCNALQIDVYRMWSAASTYRALQVSTDGGVTYWQGASDYTWRNNIGGNGAGAAVTLHDGQMSGPGSGGVLINGPQVDGGAKVIQSLNRGNSYHLFEASPDPITHVRLINLSGHAITSGTIKAWRN